MPKLKSVDEYEPKMAGDGLMLFFVRGRPGHNADIYTSTRTVQGWSEPEPLTSLNTDAEELGPEPSADGRALYFYSDRAGGHARAEEPHREALGPPSRLEYDYAEHTDEREAC